MDEKVSCFSKAICQLLVGRTLVCLMGNFLATHQNIMKLIDGPYGTFPLFSWMLWLLARCTLVERYAIVFQLGNIIFCFRHNGPRGWMPLTLVTL